MSGPFVDPRPALEPEFEMAVDELIRREGAPRTIRDQVRFAWRRRRLYGELVTKPLRMSRW